jgi:hypothetical protein
MKLLHLNKYLTREYREDEGDEMKTTPVTIAAESIRCFNPRRNDMPGTRLTFKDGGGFAVRESYADVLRYIETGEAPEPNNIRELSAMETDGNA